ncbi:hypothetical protein FB451DRAFT_1562494 [Mycena latifolia]|nr:hypothetical protein FB451DRAFT_1562494 [Mycena latifolia]
MLLKVGAPQGRGVVAGGVGPAAFGGNCRTAHRPTFARSSRPEVVEYPIYESNINKAAPLVPDLRWVLMARAGIIQLTALLAPFIAAVLASPSVLQHSAALEPVPRGCTTTLGCKGGAHQVARCKAKGYLSEDGCPVATDYNTACTGCACLVSCTIDPSN